jgi:hypothetical protein
MQGKATYISLKVVWKHPLAEMQGKAAYISLKVVCPFPGSCTIGSYAHRASLFVMLLVFTRCYANANDIISLPSSGLLLHYLRFFPSGKFLYKVHIRTSVSNFHSTCFPLVTFMFCSPVKSRFRLTKLKMLSSACIFEHQKVIVYSKATIYCPRISRWKFWTSFMISSALSLAFFLIWISSGHVHGVGTSISRTSLHTC